MSASGSHLHHAVGGSQTWRKLSEAFYSRVELDPLLRPLFPGKTLHCAIEELTAFLVQFSGGPSEDTQRRWWLSLRESHSRFKIGPRERAAWMKNMVDTLDEMRIEEPVRAALRDFFARASEYVVNTEEAPSAGEGDASDDVIRREIAWRWQAQQRLDEATAAVRLGDAERAITIAESPVLLKRFETDRSSLAGLLALMMGGGSDVMLRYVEKRLAADTALLGERYAGRTPLHEAAAHGCLTLVELILKCGADPDPKDGGGHTPLYCLANQFRSPGGGNLVHALVRGGANVNASDGVKRCTALHMAARRGHVEVAEALLDCGANLEARDSLGETPLRRAVNCEKTAVASLLLARGADAHSVGSKGLTPLLAARSRAMKQVLLHRDH